MNFIKKLYIPILFNRAKRIVDEILPCTVGTKILDLGSGGCSIAKILKDENLFITAIDIKNNSLYEGIEPVIYNGTKLPFETNTFDTTLILFVLHHASDPLLLLQEAKRVSKKRIIIKEDIYRNSIERVITQISDSIVNCEFFKHPHNNLRDEEWKKIFDNLKLKLIHTNYKKTVYLGLPFYHATYVLDIEE